ncbi:LysR substrate-binding domain-containing protein [Chromohalobacter israelensis]|uniref:LysR substrate-binding domain-containing protein n=1 Tax=Chromohalobacter israelensis TaxID=141390 RepID=UPI003AF63E98
MNRLGKALPPLASLMPFEAAARLESFSRAADELHLTQAAISRQIRALEDDLGVALFERRNRGVFLTAAGREFGRTVSAALEGIAAQANALRQEVHDGVVVLFCQLCEAFYWVMPRLASLNRRHPELEVRLVTSTRPVVEHHDYFDVALQTSGRPSGSHALAFTASDEIFPICSPGYLAAQPRPITLASLPEHCLLHHEADPPDWFEWDSWLRAMGNFAPALGNGMVFDSYPLVLQAALAGHGIALGWRRSAEHLIQSGQLVRPLSMSLPLDNALSVYTRHSAQPRAETLALLDWLQREFRRDDQTTPA